MSKREGTAISYGGEGTEEYYDCDANELRNIDNSSALLVNTDFRRRTKSGISLSDDDELLLERSQ